MDILRDGFDRLNIAQQNDVVEGLSEADRNEVIPHAEVLQQFAY